MHIKIFDNKPVLNKPKKVMEYIVIFLMLYLHSGYYMVVSGVVSGFLRVMGFLLLLGIIFLFKVRRFDTATLIAFLYTVFIMLTFTFLHQDDLYNFMIILLGGVVSGFLITTIIPLKEFARIFVNIMVVLACASLITYLIISINPQLISFFPTIGIRSGLEVKDAFLSVWLSNAQNNRNYGIFWEPGAYQTFLSFALMLELFYNDRQNKFKILVIIIALITTFSTTGYFCMFAILITFVINSYKNFDNNKKKILKFIIGIIVILTITIMVLPEQYTSLVFSKLEGLFSQDATLNFTTQARVDAIKYPAEAFFSSPLAGIGYDAFNILSETKCNGVPTFTLLNWLSLYGLFFAIIPFTGYFRLTKFFRVKGVAKVTLIMALILMISTESYLTNPFIYAVVFYGFSGGIKNEKNIIPAGNVSAPSFGERDLR